MFARPTRNEYRYSGLLVEVEVSKESISVSYNVRVKPKDTIRLASPDEKKDILDAFEERGRELCDDEAFEQIYRARLEKRRGFYLDRLMGRYGRSLVYAGLNKLTGGRYGRYRRKRRFAQLDWLILDNWISCETHHEFITDLIKSEWGARR